MAATGTGSWRFSEIHPDYYQIPVADRQALIDDDARAARESDADEEPRARRRHSRDRRRGRAHARRDESVQSDSLPAEENAREATELPAGDNVPGESLGDQPAEPMSPEATSETIASR